MRAGLIRYDWTIHESSLTHYTIITTKLTRFLTDSCELVNAYHLFDMYSSDGRTVACRSAIVPGTDTSFSSFSSTKLDTGTHWPTNNGTTPTNVTRFWTDSGKVMCVHYSCDVRGSAKLTNTATYVRNGRNLKNECVHLLSSE